MVPTHQLNLIIFQLSQHFYLLLIYLIQLFEITTFLPRLTRPLHPFTKHIGNIISLRFLYIRLGTTCTWRLLKNSHVRVANAEPVERQEGEVSDEEPGHLNVPLKEQPPQDAHIAQVTDVAHDIDDEPVPPVQLRVRHGLGLFPQLLLQLTSTVDVLAIRFEVNQLLSAVIIRVHVARNPRNHLGKEQERGCRDQRNIRPETAQHSIQHIVEVCLWRFVHHWCHNVIVDLFDALHSSIIGLSAEIVLVLNAKHVAKDSPHVDNSVQVFCLAVDAQPLVAQQKEAHKSELGNRHVPLIDKANAPLVGHFAAPLVLLAHVQQRLEASEMQEQEISHRSSL